MNKKYYILYINSSIIWYLYYYFDLNNFITY